MTCVCAPRSCRCLCEQWPLVTTCGSFYFMCDTLMMIIIITHTFWYLAAHIPAMFVQCKLWPLTLLGNGLSIFLQTPDPSNNLTQGAPECPLTILSGLTHLRPVARCFVTNWIELAMKVGSVALCVEKHQLHCDTLWSCGACAFCVIDNNVSDTNAQREQKMYVNMDALCVCMCVTGMEDSVIYAWELNAKRVTLQHCAYLLRNITM